jgi:hypothetical protein
LNRLAPLLASIACAAGAAEPRIAPDPLYAGFVEPPAEARPLVFWQWVNGNVSKEGIRLDLEWMQRVGLGGALWFDVGFRTPPVPQFVEKRIGFGTPEWTDAIRFAGDEAKRLGLLLGAQSSGGWSVSGGPSVPPEHAMKKLVWSETVLTPRSPAVSTLPGAPALAGPYQDLEIDNAYREEPRYRDVAVIAFREPAAERGARPLGFVRQPNAELLVDGGLNRAVVLVPDEHGSVSLVAQRASRAPRSLTIAVRGAMPTVEVLSNRDEAGQTWTSQTLPAPGPHAAPVRTFALGERDEPLWRIRFAGVKGTLEVLEARFDTGARVHLAQDKAGYGVLDDYGAAETTSVAPDASIAADGILDLTAKLRPDGTLDWRPSDGRWIVQRFGWSLTGRRSVPATPESIGYEVDKLDADAVRAFANAHYARFGTLDIALTDSWEAGQQNWTPTMREEFARRRGYELRAWLPALTGRVIGDVARTERFLADFRRTIADLVVEHHYGTLAAVARERGLAYWSQAAGTDRPTLVDGMKAKSRVDVPMGEFWYYPESAEPQPNYLADIRETVSAAHVYGKRVVAAEGPTTRGEEPWATGPTQLRRLVDRSFAEGINQLVLHTSAHQPFTDRKPGITLRQYGQHFTRNETWAEDAGDWLRYLSRNSWMLRQGRPVADIAILVGDDGMPAPPELIEGLRRAGYACDSINVDALTTRLRAEKRRLVRPDGGAYRAVVIAPNVQRMDLATLRAIKTLSLELVPVIGAPPVGGIGPPGDDAQIRALIAEIWGGIPGRTRNADEVREALDYLAIPPDVRGPASLRWAHRSAGEAEVYFVVNDSARSLEAIVQFRVAGRRVESWNAVDGSRVALDWVVGKESTQVGLSLGARESRILVFRGEARDDSLAPPTAKPAVLARLDGDWRVEFLDGQGTPAVATLRPGVSWTDDADPAIRHYSGRAKYSRTVDVHRSWIAENRRVELDLGTVAEIARVRVNGRDFGAWWTAPFARDITSALRPGRNEIEIVVTNYWVNRLIGDEQPGAAPVTFAPIKPYTKESPLRPSGLLGPVRLLGIPKK